LAEDEHQVVEAVLMEPAHRLEIQTDLLAGPRFELIGKLIDGAFGDQFDALG